jgi:hypothetical protein
MTTKETTAPGAKVETVEITPNVPDVSGADDTMEIVTTAPGTFGVGGIVKVGERFTIAVSAYSKNWMRPATKADAAKVKG